MTEKPWLCGAKFGSSDQAVGSSEGWGRGRGVFEQYWKIVVGKGSQNWFVWFV